MLRSLPARRHPTACATSLAGDRSQCTALQQIRSLPLAGRDAKPGEHTINGAFARHPGHAHNERSGGLPRRNGRRAKWTIPMIFSALSTHRIRCMRRYATS
ncbi:hypothetical protein EMIT0111MI5_110184 [Burkholderia sp. IT-111MI5]